VIIASAVLDVPGAIVKMTRTVKEGKFKPEIQYFGMNEGVVTLEWNERLKSQVKPATVAEVERLAGEIKAGKLKVPTGF
jgi:basic membrane lipoprotein Med (substrate-binding protein (PBP1-ABC) superfamily)